MKKYRKKRIFRFFNKIKRQTDYKSNIWGKKMWKIYFI